MGLDEEGQVIARQIFLRLVTLGEGMEDTRRRVLIYELENLKFEDMDLRKVSRAFKATLDAFGNARLLSFDRDPGTRGPTVEVAHEAIIREWPRLREWLEETRTLVRMQRQLSMAASEWMDAHRDSSFLLSGTKLAQYEGWTVSSAIALTQHEIGYLKASITARDQREMEEAERLQRELETVKKLAETERTSTLRLRGRNRLISVIGVIAMVAAIIAGVIGNRNSKLAIQNEAIASTAQAAEALAIQERDHAENENKLSVSRELAAASLSNLDSDAELSILLALQGLSVQYTSESENALRSSLATSRIKTTITTDGDIFSWAFSPDNKHLAVYEVGTNPQIWDVQTGKEVLRLDTSNNWGAISYSSNGSQIITYENEDGDKGYINKWNATTGKLESSLYAPQAGLYNQAFSFDMTRMATVGGTEGTVWNIETGEELFKLLGHTDQISSVAFSRDGTRLATIDINGIVIVWDGATGENLLTFSTSREGEYPEIKFGVDASDLIVSDSYGDIYFWEITAGKSNEVFRKNISTGGGYISTDLSLDGTLLLIGDATHGVSIWNAASREELLVFQTNYTNSFSGLFSPDGNLLATSDYIRTLKIWDLMPPGEKQGVADANIYSLQSVAYSSDGTQLATITSGLNSIVVIRDTSTNQELLTIQDIDICCSIKFSPDGKYIVTASDYGAKIWDSTTGIMVQTFVGHKDFVGEIAFNSDGSQIATASNDGTAKVWDIKSGKELLSVDVRNDGWTNDIAFSPDGKLLATVSTDTSPDHGEVVVWDSKTGEKLFLLGDNLDNDLNTCWNLAFSPDGTRLAVGYSDKTTKIWDVLPMKDQTQPMFVLRGHSDLVWDVAFSPDGNHLATASFDGTTKLWDVSSGPDQGNEITTLPGHAAEVIGIAFSPDGKYLASVSWDGTLRVYYTQIENLIAAAKKRVTRSLTTEECQKYLHMDTCPAPP